MRHPQYKENKCLSTQRKVKLLLQCCGTDGPISTPTVVQELPPPVITATDNARLGSVYRN